MLVVHRIGNARHAAGEEGGIAYERKGLLTRLYHTKALRHRNARAHAQASVDSVQGLRIAQRIAADVAAENAIAWLPQRGLHRIECTTMRAARAQQRRAGRRLNLSRFFASACSDDSFSAEHFAGLGQLHAEECTQLSSDGVYRVFAAVGGFARQLAMHAITGMHAPCRFQHFVFQNMIQFFEHDHIA